MVRSITSYVLRECAERRHRALEQRAELLELFGAEPAEHGLGESRDMFVKARQVFDRAELDELGRVMAERKQEAMAEVRSGALA